MLNKFSRLLLLANVTVFIIVLSLFSLFVYFYSVQSIYSHERKTLNTLADSVISSIDYDDHGKSDAGQPDLISSALPDESSKALLDLCLQWFNRDQKLQTQKGNFKILLPFSTEAGFQIQSNPHALILTKAGYANGNLLGYVRIAEPLAGADAELSRLASSLALGMVASLMVSAAGILVLLRISLQPVRSSIDRLRQFTADASHDFRSPLMAIKSNSSVALRYPEGMRSTDKERFLMIAEATDGMIKLTDELLLLAQGESERKIRKSSLDLAIILDELLETHKAIANDRNISVRKDVPESLWLVGEPDGLRRLFGNLIQNAFQYTPDKGQVSISARNILETVEVTVEDTGIGIESSDQAHIFDRFWRADKARSARESGYGLGLSIAQSIARQHGGDITVVSSKDKGSSFRVSIRNGPEKQESVK